MREIKFRAWDEKSMMMLDVHGITGLGVFSYQEIPSGASGISLWSLNSLDIIEYATETIEGELNTESLKIMEFTGVIARYGKKVFEGDIVTGVKARDGELLVVVYSALYGGWWLTRGGVNKEDEYYYCLNNMNEHRRMTATNIDNMQVIGNIYENPELLKPLK